MTITCPTCGNACKCIDCLIERSSIGAALRDIKERGLAAHLRDLEKRPWRRRKR